MSTNQCAVIQLLSNGYNFTFNQGVRITLWFNKVDFACSRQKSRFTSLLTFFLLSPTAAMRWAWFKFLLKSCLICLNILFSLSLMQLIYVMQLIQFRWSLFTRFFERFSIFFCLEKIHSSIENVYNHLVLFFAAYYYSKLQRDQLREHVETILQRSRDKARKFTETVELQITLKNYDPQRDKRFSGTVK